MPGNEFLGRSEQDVNIEILKRGTIGAVAASMDIIRSYQLGHEDFGARRQKADRSIQTNADVVSEEEAKGYLSRHHPGIPILGEETGLTSSDENPYMFMIDPLDGTRPFSIGALTSTAISALFNNQSRRFEAVTIGEPASGRLWFADGETTTRHSMPHRGYLEDERVVCQVWDGSITDNATVLIDNFAQFKKSSPLSREPQYRDERLMLTAENISYLISGMNLGRVAVQNYGSNGLHHALVANGGKGLAGAITTSMGGEWDVGGALTVLNAGGVVEGLRLTHSRKLEERAPLDPFAYDMLITANNQDSLNFLKRALRQAVDGYY